MKKEELRENIKKLVRIGLQEIKEKQIITEDLITFGNGRPNYDQVVILAGGTGVGKGFVLNNLVGIHGKVFDVDQLKSLGIRSKLIKDKVLKMTGRDISELDLHSPNDVEFLHIVFKELGIGDKQVENLLKAMVGRENKPNLIFDVTLANLSKLEYISKQVQEYGYSKDNIHIVWVINDIEVARKQNKDRERNVSEAMFTQIHDQVFLSLKNILTGRFPVYDYMNGDFYIVFNQKNVDTEMSFSTNGGKYISKTNYIKIKPKGKPMKTLDEITQAVIDKIVLYSGTDQTPL